MVWFSSVALSFAVLIGAYIAPAAIAPAASGLCLYFRAP